MIRMAIIGAGVWGRTHAAIFHEHRDVEVTAVCDKDRARAASLAEKYGISGVYDDIDEMLSGSPVDAVSIVLPDFMHCEAAVKCARAGKHILIEKPIATRRHEVDAIMAAVKESGVRAMVDLHNRWNPPFAEAKRAVEAGELGTLRTGYFRLNDIKWVATDMLSWTAQSSILWFLGSHSLDALRWLFDDEVTRVYAVGRRGVLDALGVDAVDTYLTTIEFSRGGIAQMENSWIVPNANPNINDIKCSILGDKGMIAIDASNHNLIQKYTDETVKVPDVLVNNVIHGRMAGFAYESIKDFVDCLVSGREFLVSMEDAANTSIAILAILESAKTGMPVNVSY